MVTTITTAAEAAVKNKMQFVSGSDPLAAENYTSTS